LRELFGLPEWGKAFTFKGGTALSKGWKLIERFSEDIDIVVDREFLGFGGDASPEAALSKKQRRARLAALKDECQKRIHGELRPALEKSIRQALPPTARWDLVPAAPEEDPDGQTLFLSVQQTPLQRRLRQPHRHLAQPIPVRGWQAGRSIPRSDPQYPDPQP
jgi:hypothetical protein